jgi:hypothetical protein
VPEVWREYYTPPRDLAEPVTASLETSAVHFTAYLPRASRP